MIVAEPMPDWVETRHHELCVAAGKCYQLRNDAEAGGDFDRGRTFLTIGDVYFLRSRAILLEWEAEEEITE